MQEVPTHIDFSSYNESKHAMREWLYWWGIVGGGMDFLEQTYPEHTILFPKTQLFIGNTQTVSSEMDAEHLGTVGSIHINARRDGTERETTLFLMGSYHDFGSFDILISSSRVPYGNEFSYRETICLTGNTMKKSKAFNAYDRDQRQHLLQAPFQTGYQITCKPFHEMGFEYPDSSGYPSWIDYEYLQSVNGSSYQMKLTEGDVLAAYARAADIVSTVRAGLMHPLNQNI